jgi:hypothetical protein
MVMFNFQKITLEKSLQWRMDRNGQEFSAFRHLAVDPKRGNDISCAIFIVRFKFSKLPLSIYRIF